MSEEPTANQRANPLTPEECEAPGYMPSAAKLAGLGFQHRPQPASTNCSGWDEYRKPWGSDHRIITVFKNGQVFIQQKPDRMPNMGVDHWQQHLPTELFFDQLLHAIGWVDAPPAPPVLTVEQLLDWPQGIGSISSADFLAARERLLDAGWDGLTRHQQLIYLVGQQNIVGELYAATHAAQKKLIRQLSQQLQEAVQELDDLNQRPA